LQARISASASREHNLAREGRLDALLKRAGAITRDQLRVEQERLLAYQKEADERGAKSDPFLTWTAVYASDVVDEAAAADALTALPKFGGPDPRYTQVDPYGRQLGVAYAYGGRGADAVPLLERMQRICAQNSQVLGFTRGWYALGLAKEQTGDLVGARAAYQKVLDRWGSAKPRSVTADKAGASLAALAAASSPAPAQARADAPPQQSSHSTRAAFDDAVRGNLSVAGTCVPLGAGTPRATLVFKRDGSVQALAIDEDPPKRITRENEDCIRRALIRTRIPAFAGPDIPTWTVDIRRVAPTSP
jgi:tetratricopeptide (TPR) repeat protein